MLTILEITLIVLLMALSAGILGWVFITTKKAFNKFNDLGISVKNKLLRINYYMVFAREFTKDELIKVSELTDEEIIKLNKIHDIKERIKTAREKVSVGAKVSDTTFR
jgi:hypothetical protein